MGDTGGVARIDVSGLGEYIREQRDQAQMSLRQLAKAADISNPYLSQVERGLRRPSAEILNRIAAGLRISAETLYIRAGILEEREGDVTVVAALTSDPTLTERQRRTLLEIYAAFQAENRASATAQTPTPGSPEPGGTRATDQVAAAPSAGDEPATGRRTDRPGPRREDSTA